MAIYNWEVYRNGGWVDIDVNTLVFSGSQQEIGVAINVDDFNEGTHLGSDDPGSDACEGYHIFNLKYADATRFYPNGSTTSEAISDTNLVQTEATIRLKFTNATSVAVSGGYFFCFNGITETVYSPGILAYAVEVGVGMAAWSKVNDAANSQGGNNAGQRLSLSGHSSTTLHYWYMGITVSPQTYGAKTQFDFGVELIYS